MDYTQVDKEFDEGVLHGLSYLDTANGEGSIDEIKSFLHSQLDKQRREIWEMAEGIKKPHTKIDQKWGKIIDEKSGTWNSALSSLQAKLGGKDVA